MDSTNKEKKIMPAPEIRIPAKSLYRLNDLLKKDKVKDEDPISFELVLTALFPNVYSNIKRYTNDCYTQGYIQGLEDGRNENKRIN